MASPWLFKKTNESDLEGQMSICWRNGYFKAFLVLCIWVFCLHVYLHSECMSGAWGQRCWIPHSWDSGWLGMLFGCWELNPGPLQEKQVFLSTEPPSHPWNGILKTVYTRRAEICGVNSGAEGAELWWISPVAASWAWGLPWAQTSGFVRLKKVFLLICSTLVRNLGWA